MYYVVNCGIYSVKQHRKKVKRERGIKKRKSLEQRKMFEKNIRCLILLSRNIIITNFGLQSVISDS